MRTLTILILFISSLYAFQATAAPKDNRTPIVHPGPSAQGEFDRTADWLATTLRAYVPRRQVTVTEDLYRASNDGEFHPNGTIRIRPLVADGLALRTGEAFGGTFIAGAVQVLIHESLHREDTEGCWRPAAGELNVEEGIVDALTVDLAPAWGWRFWRQRIGVIPFYKPEVAAIRAASAKATGSRNWRTREARGWRRALWAASCAGRVEMLREVS